ncbi:hypothetical protein ROZALSC1DRAFT_30039 [Rozella allomycis CSF55]|uniref:Uncharacterized protein n=1 Tax=Rozella allomycis (strain CSF55) TaxID=988480 RepID=A0A4P9YIU2_ROZAC|nr:hypothetical protein ROZALSC1DRAFT_30039 [Rozella allomycis CSF55]
MDNLNKFLVVCKYELKLPSELLFDTTLLFTKKSEGEKLLALLLKLAEYAEDFGLLPTMRSVSINTDEKLFQELCKSNVYIAKFNFDATKSDELSFKEGDTIIARKKSDDGWWIGECSGSIGWFPANYVEELEKTIVSEDFDLHLNLLLETEYQFIGNLDSMQKRILPLIYQSWFSSNDKKLIVDQIGKIISFHDDFFRDLQNLKNIRTKELLVSQIFKKMTNELSGVYKEYCESSYNRSKILDKYKKDEKMNKFLSKAGFETNPPIMHLSSYFLGPMERLRYYLDYLSDAEKSAVKETESLHECKVSLQKEVDNLREIVRKKENQWLLDDFDKRIEDWTGVSIQYYGDLIMEGYALEISENKHINCYILLLEKLFVCLKGSITKNQTYKLHFAVPISRKNLVAVRVPDSKKYFHLWQLSCVGHHNGSKTSSYTFSCEMESDTTGWLSKLQSLISKNGNSIMPSIRKELRHEIFSFDKTSLKKRILKEASRIRRNAEDALLRLQNIVLSSGRNQNNLIESNSQKDSKTKVYPDCQNDNVTVKMAPSDFAQEAKKFLQLREAKLKKENDKKELEKEMDWKLEYHKLLEKHNKALERINELEILLEK